MSLRTHDEYREYCRRLRFVASSSPYAPWTRVDSAGLKGQELRWTELASHFRTAEQGNSSQFPFWLGRVAKFVDPSLRESLPHAATCLSLVERIASDDVDESRYCTEAVVLALRIAPMGDAFPKVLQALLSAVSRLDVDFQVAWMLDLLGSVTSAEHAHTVVGALPKTMTAVDRAEVALAQLRLEPDSAAAQQTAEALRGTLDSLSVDGVLGHAAGSAQHRVTLARLRVVRELSYRARELDACEDAARLAEAVFAEATRVGLPATAAVPPHDLAGVDELAQVASADWLAAALMSEDSFLGVTAQSRALSSSAAVAARRSVYDGRFKTRFDACVATIDDVGSAVLKGRLDEALELLGTATRLANVLRSYALEMTICDRFARVLSRKMRISETAAERTIMASETIRFAASAGERELVEEAACELAVAGGATVGSVVQQLATVRRVERAAKLVAMRELSSVATDEEVSTWVREAAVEMNGPFSMNSRVDVQRAAILTSGVLLEEAFGLPLLEDFRRLVQATVSNWRDVVTGGARTPQLAVRAVSEAAEHLLHIPASLLPIEAIEGLLQVAQELPKDERRVDGTAWVNFARPAIEGVLSDGSGDETTKRRIIDTLLAVIPKWETRGEPAETSFEGVPPFPPGQQSLLQMTYRCLLGDMNHESAHAAVTSMVEYCSYFSDGTKLRGLRLPLRTDLALKLAPHGEAEDEKSLLAVLLRMAACESLDGGARADAVRALRSWARSANVSGRQGQIATLEDLNPAFISELLRGLQSPLRVAERGFMPTSDPGSIAAGLLLLGGDLVRSSVAAQTPDAARLLQELLGVSASLASSEDSQIRGAAANVCAWLLCEPAVQAEGRSELAVRFLSSAYDAEEVVSTAAIDGFRWAVERYGLGAVDARACEVVVSTIGDRALRGTRDVRARARLALHALRERHAPGIEGEVGRTAFTPGDERSWRRHLRIQEAQEAS